MVIILLWETYFKIKSWKKKTTLLAIQNLKELQRNHNSSKEIWKKTIKE